MDAEGVAFVGKVQEERLCLGRSFRAAFDWRKKSCCFSRTKRLGLRLYGPGLNQIGISTLVKWAL